MDSRLAEELELLGEVYCDELEIKPGQNGVKLKVHCLPLLEDLNIEHHYEYDHPFLYAYFDVPAEYPVEMPKVHLESTHSKVSIGSHLSDISDKLLTLFRTLRGQPVLLDAIECIRTHLYHEVARKNKHFKKRNHKLNDDQAFLYDDEDEELEENLMRKTEYTEVTQDRFAAWLVAFRAEMKAKQDKDPVYQRKKLILTKPSGRMIFNDRTKDFANYFDDEKNEEDDEAVDLKGERAEDEGQEEVDIDEDVFGDEDDLDDEEFVVDDN